MKKLLLVVTILVTNLFALLSQTPMQFKYQAVLKNQNGTDILANTQVTIDVQIIKNSTQTIVFTESQSAKSNTQGLITLTIGSVNTTGLANVGWNNDTYTMKVFANGTEIGYSQLLSVPYSINAKYAESIEYSNVKNKPVKISDLTLDANSKTISNVSNPVNAKDVVTKEYADKLKKFIVDSMKTVLANQNTDVTALQKQILALQLQTGIAIKDLEGNIYQTIVIGNQTWMVENLRVTKLADGTMIPNVKAYNNDESNVIKYGRLYSWNAAMNNSTVAGSQGICPTGYHIPTKADWNELSNTITQLYDNGTFSMKAIGEWNSSYTLTNASGFSAMPAGIYRATSNSFYNNPQVTLFWTSSLMSANNMYAECFMFDVNSKSFTTNEYLAAIHNIPSINKSDGISIRCVKNK